METENIEQTVTVRAGAHEIYETLMDSARHSELTGSECKFSREIGGRFSAYDGYIEGLNEELIKDRKIVQSWRGSDWPEGHYSQATFSLEEKDGVTTLTFTQTGVPVEFYEDVAQGWYDYYWEPMKKLLED